MGNLVPAKQQQERDRNSAEDIHQGRTDRCRRYRLEIRPEELPCSSAEANYLPCLHAEGFDDSIAGDGFVQDILNIGKLVLPATRSVPHPPANLPR